MPTKPRKLISFDWAIKKILRSKANFAILEGFLSELLFDDITITEILETESNKNALGDKFNRLDIKVKNSKDEIVLIEIQYNRELDYLQRMLYATSKIIIEHIKESEAYSKIVKVISINILYFDLGEGDDYIYKGTTSFIGLHNHSQLKLNADQAELYKTEQIEQVYPEYYLIKINNFNNVAKDTLDQWIYFLKNEEVKDNFKAKGLVQAKEVLDYLKYSEEERLEYESYKESLHYQASMYESTYVIGILKGEKKGKMEEKMAIAKKMLQKNIEIAIIAEVTGLTTQEIESINLRADNIN
ncbi:MAG: Rpn family recombination-promoting nuclease/putative transposase [Methylococcaceae bacterium]